MENKRTSKNRILKFEQPGEYYNRRALRLIGKSDIWGALASLRQALEKEPMSAEYRMSIAELLAQMGLYELSCEMLYWNMVNKTDRLAECYFALASNFFALRMGKLSQDCIASYMQLEPDGEFAPDCEELLYILEHESEQGAELSSAAMLTAETGKRALDEGRHADAIQNLSNALAMDDTITYARNNLALAYYCVQEPDKAIDQAQKVLEKNENDVFALCNMAIFLNGQGKYDEAKAYLDRAAAQVAIDDEDIYKICVTCADLDLHEEVAKHTGDILKFSPYDENALYLQSLSQYNSGNFSAAYKAISKLLLLEPDSAVYQHVMKCVALAAAGEEQHPEPLDYSFSLPTVEAIERFKDIHRFISLPKDEAAKLLESDERIYSTVLWCLSLEDSDLKYDLVMRIAALDSIKGVRMMQMMLLSQEQSDDFKKTLVMALYTQEIVQPPYQAIVGGNMAEIRLKKTEVGNRKIPVGYERVLRKVLEDERIYGDDAAAGIATQLWIAYMAGIAENEMPPLKGAHSWAAAVVYAAMRLSGVQVDAKEVARRYKTRESAIVERYGMFEKLYEKALKENDFI